MDSNTSGVDTWNVGDPYLSMACVFDRRSDLQNHTFTFMCVT